MYGLTTVSDSKLPINPYFSFKERVRKTASKLNKHTHSTHATYTMPSFPFYMENGLENRQLEKKGWGLGKWIPADEVFVNIDVHTLTSHTYTSIKSTFTRPTLLIDTNCSFFAPRKLTRSIFNMLNRFLGPWVKNGCVIVKYRFISCKWSWKLQTSEWVKGGGQSSYSGVKVDHWSP